MIWHKLDIFCSRDDSFFIEEILIGLGAISIFIEDNSNKPIYEPEVGETPLWERLKLSALYDRNISNDEINSILKFTNFYDFNISHIEDINWVSNYQKKMQPLSFGEKLWVVPSWVKCENIEDKKIIKMNPGMAFGSGSHETTHLCLEYLEANQASNKVVLDYGSGSGILSIAAALLKAKLVFSIDIDPQAKIATKENAKINNLEEKIFLLEANEIIDESIDLLIANIIYKQLIESRDFFFMKIKRNGQLILSGILRSQVSKLKKAYAKKFRFEKISYKGDWCLIVFSKK